MLVEPPGIESPAACAPNVADRHVKGAGEATKDDERRREVSASPSPAGDAVEAALAEAIRGATCAARWDVVGQLASELEARRMERAQNMVPLLSGGGRQVRAAAVTGGDDERNGGA
jgi:hypothetical protein